jgi:hypothetical protein
MMARADSAGAACLCLFCLSIWKFSVGYIMSLPLFVFSSEGQKCIYVAPSFAVEQR